MTPQPTRATLNTRLPADQAPQPAAPNPRPAMTTDPPSPPVAVEVIEPDEHQRLAVALPAPRTRRRWRIPLVLFLVTCGSTFWAGVTHWQPFLQPNWMAGNGLPQLDSAGMLLRQTILANWSQGAAYMLAVLAILITHEMGHFVTTLWYRIPASLPFFIPFPVTPIGTMGAVIGMEGYRANRREIFDIGLAGPVAGLVVAIPIVCYGIVRLDGDAEAYGSELYYCPLLVQWLAAALRPDLGHLDSIVTSQLNPWLMAGWVGLLVTGLNMMPVSQLDGGHVVYALFGKRGAWIPRAFIFTAIAYVVFAEVYIWAVMVVLVILIGVDHPPTADDRVALGWRRTAIGLMSLAIPLLCFPARGLMHIYP